MGPSSTAKVIDNRNENSDYLNNLLEDLRSGSEPTFPHSKSEELQHFVSDASHVNRKTSASGPLGSQFAHLFASHVASPSDQHGPEERFSLPEYDISLPAINKPGVRYGRESRNVSLESKTSYGSSVFTPCTDFSSPSLATSIEGSSTASKTPASSNLPFVGEHQQWRELGLSSIIPLHENERPKDGPPSSCQMAPKQSELPDDNYRQIHNVYAIPSKDESFHAIFNKCLLLHGLVPDKNEGVVGDYSSQLLASSQAPFSSTMNANPKVLFQPSRMRQALYQGITAQPPPALNYQGDLNSQSFLSQKDNLPDIQNCSLFITNIPTWVGYTHMFAHINVGAVFALHLMPPTVSHSQQAAKLVFMSSDSAARFIQSRPMIAGQPLHIVYNRHGYLTNPRRLSRVLTIRGPSHMMNLDFWCEFFHTYSIFVLENFLYLWADL
ncbi:hypothetical protein BGZ60DRAFT_568050 [Tricladium varicosporioides]|nr:hypothetical protein BGZ60DRAFT_568050 [Hymenoscyphus varicosporioides]